MKVAERTDAIADVSSAYTSPAFTIEQMVSYSYQLIASGAISGTVKLQTSNNAFEPPFGNAMYLVESPSAVWDDVPSSSVVLAAQTSFVQEYNADSGTRYVRLVWAPTAGTGTASIRWWAKGRI